MLLDWSVLAYASCFSSWYKTNWNFYKKRSIHFSIGNNEWINIIFLSKAVCSRPSSRITAHFCHLDLRLTTFSTKASEYVRSEHNSKWRGQCKWQMPYWLIAYMQPAVNSLPLRWKSNLIYIQIDSEPWFHKKTSLRTARWVVEREHEIDRGMGRKIKIQGNQDFSL